MPREHLAQLQSGLDVLLCQIRSIEEGFRMQLLPFTE